jgi:hypothetical protein
MSFAPEENLDDLEPDNSAAAARVSVPGILLIVVGVLNLLGAALFGFQVVDAARTPPAEFAARQEIGMDMLKKIFPQMAEEIDKQPKQDPQGLKNQSLMVNGGLLIILLIVGIIPIIAGARMRGLRGYGLAIAGAILAAFPCIAPGCCFIIGPVAGIWSLVVLSNAEVKAAFK